MDFIPYAAQWLDNEDIDEVVKVLKSDWLTQGPKIRDFENSLAQYCGAKYAVCVSSGTAALHIACLAAGLDKGDEVITSPVTFVASANCISFCGGKPVFVDIDPSTINIDPAKIEQHITKKTKAIIPVHFAGHPCDLKAVKKIAKNNDLYVIEDAAHALGAKYKNTKIGSCKYSDMTILSFHPVKHVTTGEGGAVLTNNKNLYEKLIMLRSHGITKKKPLLNKKDAGPWYYEMQMLGYNYRITDIQSALGMSQLKKIDSFVDRRRQLVHKYNKAFKDAEWISAPVEKDDCYSSYHLYVLQIDFKKIKKTRKEFVEYLFENNIGTQVHYIPVHLQPFYKKEFRYKKGQFKIAENYYNKALSIPLYPKMTDADIDYVIDKVLSLGL
ncbi:UDP-4-amino-4,6-dideoxy-N-acetyl-beta-L-altrosamine transaminase [bacterium]